MSLILIMFDSRKALTNSYSEQLKMLISISVARTCVQDGIFWWEPSGMRWENIGGKCGVWVVGVNQNIIQFFFWDWRWSDLLQDVELTIEYLSSRSRPGSCRTPPPRTDWETPRRGRRPRGSCRWGSAGRRQFLILSKIQMFPTLQQDWRPSPQTKLYLSILSRPPSLL